MVSFKQQQIRMAEQMHQQNSQEGIHIMNHPDNTCVESKQSSSSSPGGIGGAMAKAESCSHMTQAHVKGLGDSFHRTAPVSAPRLDSFKMIKVIGKGSFGEFFNKSI